MAAVDLPVGAFCQTCKTDQYLRHEDALGQTVCTKCGHVLEESTTRAETGLDRQGQYQGTLIHNDTTFRTTAGQPATSNEEKGRRRRERKSHLVYNKIAMMCGAVGLANNRGFVKRVHALHNQLSASTRKGRTVDMTCAAIVYLQVRIEEKPVLIQEIAHHYGLNVAHLWQAYIKARDELLGKVSNTVQKVNPEKFLDRYVKYLEISNSNDEFKVIKYARNLIILAQKACIDAGRRVNIILAAVFVLALRAAGRKGDDEKVASVFGAARRAVVTRRGEITKAVVDVCSALPIKITKSNLVNHFEFVVEHMPVLLELRLASHSWDELDRLDQGETPTPRLQSDLAIDHPGKLLVTSEPPAFTRSKKARIQRSELMNEEKKRLASTALSVDEIASLRDNVGGATDAADSPVPPAKRQRMAAAGSGSGSGDGDGDASSSGSGSSSSSSGVRAGTHATPHLSRRERERRRIADALHRGVPEEAIVQGWTQVAGANDVVDVAMTDAEIDAEISSMIRPAAEIKALEAVRTQVLGADAANMRGIETLATKKQKEAEAAANAVRRRSREAARQVARSGGAGAAMAGRRMSSKLNVTALAQRGLISASEAAAEAEREAEAEAAAQAVLAGIDGLGGGGGGGGGGDGAGGQSDPATTATS